MNLGAGALLLGAESLVSIWESDMERRPPVKHGAAYHR